AKIAREALRLMHLVVPDDDTTPLPPADELADEEGACVRGCYRCLLSYYNQPDHDVIDRRDPAARQLLVRLAQSRTTLAAAASEAAGTDKPNATASDGWTARWIAATGTLGGPIPQWTMHESVVPQWPASYAAAILPDTPPAIREQLELEGSTLFVFPTD